MNKADLISAALKKSNTEMTKVAATALFDATFTVIGKNVKKNGRIAIPGFGVFKLTKRSARKGRNPQTGETIKIKASKSISFKPSVALKGAL